ncbi:MAG: MBL fold metallo-hydrolase [Pseudomonadales bacterium]|nr:MBL fold metallo-hydrolase [Pseudomonadales bacterium]
MLTKLSWGFILLINLSFCTQASGHSAVELDAVRHRSIQHFYPNEPLPESDMRVTVLGSGTPFPRSGQAGPSILVEAGNERVLLDIGSGSPQNLASLEIPFRLLDKVFLTHLHVDHVGGLDSLWLGGWTYGRSTSLQVFGPPGTQAFCGHLQQAYEWDVRGRIAAGLPKGGSELKCNDYKAGEIYKNNDLSISAFEVVHIEKGHAFGFRVEYKSRSFVFSGDTTFSENLIHHSKDVDLIIHESFPPAEIYAEKTGRSLALTRHIAEEVHASPAMVGKVFSETKPRLGVLYHLYNNPEMVLAAMDDLRTTYNGPVQVAYDLMVIEIGDRISVRDGVVGKKPWPVGIKTKTY